jgi:hypothetical protein
MIYANADMVYFEAPHYNRQAIIQNAVFPA